MSRRKEFITSRRQAWQEYDQLLVRLESSRGRLRSFEVTEFSRLLRELAADLVTVRSRSLGADLEEALNGRLMRGYHHFYRSPGGNVRRVIRFLAVGFPRRFRANFRFILVAALALFVPMLAASILIQDEPERAELVMPEENLEQMRRMYSRGHNSEGPGWTEARFDMAGFYVRNNTTIALRCFALGLFFGIGSLYILIYNGIAIGTVMGTLLAAGLGENFLSFVVSHGSFELTAIVIAGGAGLMLGSAILHPGRRSRLESLRIRGREAVELAFGAAVMLFVAALIEAFWSPSGVPIGVKYLVGLSLWVLIFLYLAVGGRGGADSEVLAGPDGGPLDDF